MRRPMVIFQKKIIRITEFNYIVVFFLEDIELIIKFMKASIRADSKNYQDVYY